MLRDYFIFIPSLAICYATLVIRVIRVIWVFNFIRGSRVILACVVIIVKRSLEPVLLNL